MKDPRRNVLSALAALLLAACCSCSAPRLDYKITSEYAISDPQFQRAMGALLGPPLIPGNSAVAYLNGDEIFPAMLDAIAKSQKTITFETFVYWSGKTGKAFADAFAERARAGVHVHILIDAVGGSGIDDDDIADLRKAGAHVVFYHALKWFEVGSAVRINYRTHRKLLILDGAVAFTGGVGIADEWQGHAQDADHWRDTHYRVEGPVVSQLQAAFMDSWIQETGEVLHSIDYFPPLVPTGTLVAQCFMSSYRGGSESMHLMYLLSIAASRSSIRLSTPYFVPDQPTSDMLIEAAQRGVRIQIILPGAHSDAKLVRLASRARWEDLLTAGIEIYEYQPTMYHCKLMVVDDFWTSVGSSNFDNRSFSLNDEANLNILDAAFAARQSAIFEADLAHSKRITLQDWLNRPLLERIQDHLTSMFGSQF